MLSRLTPLGTKSDQSRRDEAEAGVRGVGGLVTHPDALLSHRLALLQLQPHQCAYIFWKCSRPVLSITNRERFDLFDKLK